MILNSQVPHPLSLNLVEYDANDKVIARESLHIGAYQHKIKVDEKFKDSPDLRNAIANRRLSIDFTIEPPEVKHVAEAEPHHKSAGVLPKVEKENINAS